MKKLVILLTFFALYTSLFGQLNIQLLDHLQYDFDANDIWGWVDENGTEYALVGTTRGTSIVSLADPSNVQEVAFVPGATTAWRDIKTRGRYAYVTQDVTNVNEGVGIAIIDLSKLPNSVEYVYWRPTLDLGLLTDCHNIWIDENGIAYLAGCDVNNGGIILLDILTDPLKPTVIAYGPSIYAHDVYAKNNLMYASQLGSGLAIYDVSNPSNITNVAKKETPFDFTHNAWANSNNSVVFTTDERGNAPVAAYSIASGVLEELDQFRPLSTINRGVIPHNVHVLNNNWVVTSYYTSGVVIIDGTRPNNMIEVANFDTWGGADGGFHGAWGAYPFLPSGLLLVSDIESGLYVLDVNYKQGCWLEGKVTNAQTGEALFEANVSIASSEINQEKSGLDGKYATGLASAGTYAVTYSKFGYEPKTMNVTLNNGVLKTLDVALQPLNTYAVSGATIKEANGQAVPGARIIFKNDDIQYATISNLSGQFSVQNIIEDTYDIYALAWGYLHKVETGVNIQSNQSITLKLTPGYQDDFVVDLGWEKTAAPETTSGFWAIGEPIGTYISTNNLANPEFDIPNDIGESCFMTGNGGGNTGSDDVDGGSVTITSPLMDLSTYDDPLLSYYLWFQRFDSNQGTTNDTLVVMVDNGLESVTIEVLDNAQSGWRDQSQIHLKEWIDITTNMRISFTTADFAPVGNVVEAAVDAFLVQDAALIATNEQNLKAATLKVYPNPFQDQLFFDYHIPRPFHQGRIRVLNALGQMVSQISIKDNQGKLPLQWRGDSGIYFLQLEVDGQVLKTVKVIKS